MSFFNNLKVKFKIVLILSTIVALFVIGLVYIMGRISVINDQVDVMYKTNLLSVDFLIEADRDAYQSSIAVSHLLNRHEEQKTDPDLVADVQDNLSQVKERFVKAEKLWEQTGVAKTEDFEVFHKNYTQLAKHTASLLSSIENREFDAASKLYFGEYGEVFSTVRTAMDNLTGVFLEGAEKRYQESVAQSKNIFASALITIVLCIALSILFGVVLTRGIVIPVTMSSSIAERMSDGDLTVQSSVKSKDEFGTMAKSLATMIGTLRSTISEVQRAAVQVSSGADQLTSASSQISSGAVEQAASAEEVSAAMEEMSASIQQNASNAQRTEAIAVKLARDAEVSGKSVLRAVEAMQKITQKISIVEDIARQTNMLSLNASIEAARAGEHGKGFAVVASAVGKLATRSQDAAAEISLLSNETVEVADQARRMLSDLIPDIRKTTELIQEISVSSIEQSRGADQINVAIRGLDEVIQQNSAAAEETASTAQELSDQAKALMNSIRFFKVDRKSDHKVSRTDQLHSHLKVVEETEDAFIRSEPLPEHKTKSTGIELEDF